MEPVEWVALIIGAAALVAAINTIWTKGIVPTIKFFHRMSELYDVLVKVEERSRQLEPNSGSHLRDDAKRTRELLEEHLADSKRYREEMQAEILDLWRTVAGAPTEGRETK